jgi:TonB family protein
MRLSPLKLSFFIHLSFISFIILLNFINHKTEIEIYNVPIQFPETNLTEQKIIKVEPQKTVVLKSVNSQETVTTKGQRQVYGLNRNSYTDDKAGTVDAKMGNTIAKQADTEKLNALDSDSLPVPTEEYLVSEMPRVLTEIRPVYPKEAKEKGIEGPVTLDILIDESGKVRQAVILSGLGYGLDEAALKSIFQFKFYPAKVDGKSVAVRIRYILRFVLEK